MKVIIVGGVAGGASCAARLRRLDEKAEIVMVERGPYVSYANCGLPYHVGGVIEKEVEPARRRRQHVPQSIRRRRADRLRGDRRLAREEDRRPAQRGDRRSDDRVLRQARPVSRGAVRPPAAAGHRPAGHLPCEDRARRAGDPRVDREGDALPVRHAPLLGVPDRAAQDPRGRVGGGFIGLETAENLVHRGFDVTLVEMLDQVLAPLDREMARIVEGYVERHGIRLALNDGVAAFQAGGERRDRRRNEIRQGLSGGRRDPRRSASGPTRRSPKWRG